MSLPTDVLDQILSFLQEDRATLIACAQIHPIFSQLVERYLYAHIIVDNDGTIDNHHGSGGGNKLTLLLSKRQYIANYVRSLEIRIISDPACTKPTWSDGLLTISSSFPLLTRITLAAQPGRVAWGLLQENFRLAFIEALRSLAIIDVSIIHIPGFPLSVLNDCNAVKKLALDGWTYPGANSIADSPNGPLLASLSIKQCGGDSLTRLINWTPIRNLRTLQLAKLHNVLGYARLPELLERCWESLTTLDIDLGNKFHSYSEYIPANDAVQQPLLRSAIPFTLSSLTQLKHLIIRANVDFLFYDSFKFGSPLPGLADLMRTAFVPECLTFALRFHLNKWTPIPKASDFISIPIVGLLDNCRSPSTKMHVRAICDVNEFDAEFLQIVLSVLNGCALVNHLVERGLLVVIPEIPPVPSEEAPSPWEGTTSTTAGGPSEAQPLKALRKWLPRSLPFFDLSRSGQR